MWSFGEYAIQVRSFEKPGVPEWQRLPLSHYSVQVISKSPERAGLNGFASFML